jgi:hypothetical protein
MKYIICVFSFLLFFQTNLLAGSPMLAKFDHSNHLEKVFKVNSIQCSHCHNFDLDTKTNEIKLNEFAKKSIFKMPLKQICHECHQSAAPEHVKAPQTCFTCHRSMEGINKIKPANHTNLAWKSSHSTEARVNSDYCMNCHMTSQCAKCHLQTNHLEKINHPRNFKFFHWTVNKYL